MANAELKSHSSHGSSNFSRRRVNRRSMSGCMAFGCIRKYTATRSLGRPSGLTECPATSFSKISLNHECQARIECRYARSWRYPVCIRGSTPVHGPDKTEWPKKAQRGGERGGKGAGRKEKQRQTEMEGDRAVEEKGGRFSITVAVRAQFGNPISQPRTRL